MDKRIDRFKNARPAGLFLFSVQDGIDIFPFVGEGELLPGSRSDGVFLQSSCQIGGRIYLARCRVLPDHHMDAVAGTLAKLFADGFQDANARAGAHVGDRPAVGDAVKGAFDRDQILLAKTGHRIVGKGDVCTAARSGQLDDRHRIRIFPSRILMVGKGDPRLLNGDHVIKG